MEILERENNGAYFCFFLIILFFLKINKKMMKLIKEKDRERGLQPCTVL